MTTQHAAARALADLVREDAPTVEWGLPHDHRKLHGHLHAATTRDHLTGLAAWQRVLGAGPVTRAAAGDWQHLTVTGSYSGVPVDVVAMIPREE